MKNISKSKLITVIFIAFIFIMAIMYIVMPKKSFSDMEKRYLASFPEFSAENVLKGKFTSGFENYLTDHTPFRNFFVSLNSYYELAKGNNGSNGIYKGRDGWLIEKPLDRDNRLDRNVRNIKTFAKKIDVPVALAVVPEKGYIYGDMLPEKSLEYMDREYIDTIKNICKDDLKFIDLSDTLNSAKKENSVFYKTDHHWTSCGAYKGYISICEALNLKPSDESEFETEVTNDFYGTSFSTSMYTLTKPDTIEVMRNKKTKGNAEVNITDTEKISSDNMFFTDALKGNDKYVVFLDGNHPLVNIKTKAEGGKLLVIKDSFAHCLVPFLADNYSEITMVDLRYYKKPVSALLNNDNYDQVLFLYGMENIAESKDLILR